MIISKLYFLPGMLRDTNQSDFNYIALLKDGLDFLGVTYPTVGSTDTLDTVTTNGNATFNPITTGPITVYSTPSSTSPFITMSGSVMNLNNTYTWSVGKSANVAQFNSICTFESSPSFTDGLHYGSTLCNYYTFYTGATTIPATIIDSTLHTLRSFKLTSTGTVVTYSQGGSVRAASAASTQISLANDTTSGTVSHIANFHVLAPYCSAFASGVTFNNVYGVLINNLREYSNTGSLNITNTWGIYQDGALDKNYFNGNVLIKTTVDSGFNLDVNGTGRVNNLTTNNIQFNTASVEALAEGKAQWNNTDGTLDIRLKGNQVTLQVGQEELIRVVNKTANDLLQSNYQAVYLSGAIGGRPKVDLAVASSITSLRTIGVVTEDIQKNAEGFVTTTGFVRDLNTTGSLQGETWVDGDILYLSSTVPGGLTKLEPTQLNYRVIVGYVIRAHATQGFIYVKVQHIVDNQPPKLTGAQAEALVSPEEGLIIYATIGNGVTINAKGWWGWNGTTWKRLDS